MRTQEVQERLSITRKALLYYEEQGLLEPKLQENGYRDYSEEDCKRIAEIQLYRKLDLGIADIKDLLAGKSYPVSLLREKQSELTHKARKQVLLEDLFQGRDKEEIRLALSALEREETLYQRLERIFPGYFGQAIFACYKPFLGEASRNAIEEEAFTNYVAYLDSLPTLVLSQEEKVLLEQSSAGLSMESLEKLNQQKIEAVENFDAWLEAHSEAIAVYRDFQKSEEYQKSLLYSLTQKIRRYFMENRYYEIAIPLLCRCSPSYALYYKKLESVELPEK